MHTWDVLDLYSSTCKWWLKQESLVVGCNPCFPRCGLVWVFRCVCRGLKDLQGAVRTAGAGTVLIMLEKQHKGIRALPDLYQVKACTKAGRAEAC